MARTITVECPSGLVVTVREFKVSDEDLTTDKAAVRKGAATTNLLKAICEEIEDAGPYQLKGQWVDWGDVLQGDRLVTLLKNKIHTHGPEYDVSPNCPGCGRLAPNVIDLEELKIKPLPEASLTHVESDAPLLVILPNCEKRVGFRLMRGRDEKALRKLKKQKKGALSSAYFRYRIVSVEGVSQNEWVPWIKDLGGRDSTFLRAAFDEADCGVDQEAVFECDDCDTEWREDVVFGPDFLFPKFRGKTGVKT